MKKFICIFLIVILCFPASALAAEYYITIEPYPLSSHVLGDDLVIYADTNLPIVVLGLYRPASSGYSLIYSETILDTRVLKQGYVIGTSSVVTKNNPEGNWKLIIQYGTVKDEISITMTSEPIYNRSVRIAEYTDNTLTHTATYPCRGISTENNTISFTLEDETQIRIFSWDNFSPADSGETQLFIATYKDGYMTDIRMYKGELVDYGNHVTLNISDFKRLEIFYWYENLAPVT